jgi:hypothetical protein
VTVFRFIHYLAWPTSVANKVCKVYIAQVGWHGRAVGGAKGGSVTVFRFSDSVPFYSLLSVANKVCKVCQGYSAQVGWHGRAVGLEKGGSVTRVPFYSFLRVQQSR